MIYVGEDVWLELERSLNRWDHLFVTVDQTGKIYELERSDLTVEIELKQCYRGPGGKEVTEQLWFMF
jgi:hypothetical protein